MFLTRVSLSRFNDSFLCLLNHYRTIHCELETKNSYEGNDREKRGVLRRKTVSVGAKVDVRQQTVPGDTAGGKKKLGSHNSI